MYRLAPLPKRCSRTIPDTKTFLTFYGTPRFHNSPLLLPILSHIKPVQADRPILPPSHPQCYPPICAYVFQILSFLRSLPTKNTHAFFFPPMRATFCAHPSSLMVSSSLSGEQYQPRSSKLSSFLLPRVTLPLDPDTTRNRLTTYCAQTT